LGGGEDTPTILAGAKLGGHEARVEASMGLLIVCWNMNFIPLLRINRIRSFMLFGKEERWLAKEKCLCFLFTLQVPPGACAVHTHTREPGGLGKENEVIEPDGSGSTPRRPVGWMNLHL
jgi:hypothetical protein